MHKTAIQKSTRHSSHGPQPKSESICTQVTSTVYGVVTGYKLFNARTRVYDNTRVDECVREPNADCD